MRRIGVLKRSLKATLLSFHVLGVRSLKKVEEGKLVMEQGATIPGMLTVGTLAISHNFAGFSAHHCNSHSDRCHFDMTAYLASGAAVGACVTTASTTPRASTVTAADLSSTGTPLRPSRILTCAFVSPQPLTHPRPSSEQGLMELAPTGLSSISKLLS